MIFPGSTLIEEAPHWDKRVSRGTFLRTPLRLTFSVSAPGRIDIPICKDGRAQLGIYLDPLPWLVCSVCHPAFMSTDPLAHPTHPHHVVLGYGETEFGTLGRFHVRIPTPICTALFEADPATYFRFIPRRRPAALELTDEHVILWTPLFTEEEEIEECPAES